MRDFKALIAAARHPDDFPWDKTFAMTPSEVVSVCMAGKTTAVVQELIDMLDCVSEGKAQFAGRKVVFK